MCSPHCLAFGDKIGKIIALGSLQALDLRYQEGKLGNFRVLPVLERLWGCGALLRGAGLGSAG